MPEISDTSICNEALILLGADPITSLQDDVSQNQRICNAIYKSVGEYVLTDHVWNFAQERFNLVQVAGEPVWTDDLMTVIYSKPADTLRINFVNIETAIFKLEGDKILSNEEGLKIKYTKKITDPTLFFPKFREAFVARLAAEMAYAITKKRTVATTLFEIYYEKKLPEAKAADSQQGTPAGLKQDEWLLARLHGSSPLSGGSGRETWYPCF